MSPMRNQDVGFADFLALSETFGSPRVPRRFTYALSDFYGFPAAPGRARPGALVGGIVGPVRGSVTR